MKQTHRKTNVKSVFLMMPLNQESSIVHELVQEAVVEAGKLSGCKITVNRLDFMGFSHNTISESLLAVIMESDLIVADISHNRPNVMYELGIAHAARKPVILIASEAAFMDRPFDIANFFVNVYGGLKSVKSFRNLLSRKIVDALENPESFTLTASHSSVQPDKKPTVFISYSHADKDYLARLQVHLRPLIKENRIELWDDTRIKAGEKWKEEIGGALDRAAIAVLLISADFLASDFIIDNELPPLLRAAEENGTTILPLIVKPCRFIRDRNLSVFQSINNPAEPLMKLSPNDQEELYARVSERIENELQAK